MASRRRDPLLIRQPNRYLLRMLGFLVAVGLIISLIKEPLLTAILANPPLNIGILSVLALGILYTFGQILNLRPEIKWLNRYRAEGFDAGLRTPNLLAPMARLLGDRGAGLAISPGVLRAILDSLGARLDESRDISRYMVGLLIFLGLLGTFWGLLQTVSAVGDTIRSLSVGIAPIEESFEELRSGLEAPLSGMGIAFSSSLIGLAGSLILGFLDLQMAQAQNRFYNDIEEWLSAGTQLDEDIRFEFSPEGAGEAPSLATLVQATAAGLRELSTQMTHLNDHMRTEAEVMKKVAENQAKLTPILEALSRGGSASPGAATDDYMEAIYGHLRNLDVTLQHLMQNAAGETIEAAETLSAEIRALTETIRNATEAQ